MCWVSWNLGTSTSWNPQGLSSTVQELLYFYLFYFFGQECVNPGKRVCTFESMWQILINTTPWDGGYKKECIWISHTIIVLAPLLENWNPWYGRMFICENSSFARLQCTGVPYRATSAIMWFCPTIWKSCKWVQAFRSERGSTVNIHCSGPSVSSDKDMSAAIT